MDADQIISHLQRLGDPAKAAHAQRFFKTAPGEYGEGDRFLGIRMPVLRSQIPDCRGLPLAEIECLLHSSYHEVRMFALLVLVWQFERANAALQTKIHRLYLSNTQFINNWDLVDTSAPQIVGGYLLRRSRKLLYRLAGSDSLWERRISVLACFSFIRAGQFEDLLALSERLLHDPHELIHKAVGWMLREVGKRDSKTAERFLIQHYPSMPRVMLRYAIEQMPEPKRQAFLKGTAGHS
ncbi:MAG: DNA alkylation repair protein [Candidatus Thiodiazotropha sp.]|jgi:3-methyladenine DNA glycosylase AlkD